MPQKMALHSIQSKHWTQSNHLLLSMSIVSIGIINKKCLSNQTIFSIGFIIIVITEPGLKPGTN